MPPTPGQLRLLRARGGDALQGGLRGAAAAMETSADLLRHAGCHEVIQLGEMLGRSMALRIASTATWSE